MYFITYDINTMLTYDCIINDVANICYKLCMSLYKYEYSIMYIYVILYICVPHPMTVY